MTFNYCYAVPGKDSIIDAENPETGKSLTFGQTIEEIRLRYPRAVRYKFDVWCEAKAARQDTPLEWVACTEEQYHYALGCLPPEAWRENAFLLGEPSDHHALSGLPRFAAYKEVMGHFSCSSRPVTKREFRDMNLAG